MGYGSFHFTIRCETHIKLCQGFCCVFLADNNIELDEDGSPPSRKRPHEDDACEEVYESSIMASTIVSLFRLRLVPLSLDFDYGL